jgi:uncharacterized membrane protein
MTALYEPQAPTQGPTPQPPRRLTRYVALEWWYTLTASRPARAHSSLAAREASRRGRIASLIIAGMLLCILITMINLPFALANWPSLLVTLAGCAVAIPLNRAGQLVATGWALTLALEAALIIPLIAVWGMLDPIYLPVYYLLVAPLLVAVSLLPSSTVFVVAAANSLFVAFDIRFEPHNMMWTQMVTTGSELLFLLIGPVALHVIVALLAYLWVRSADAALRRADRADDLARLERATAAERARLAAGIQQILQTHVRFANGDMTTRAPTSQDSVLWQVGVALNNLLARYQRLAQEDGFSRAAGEQVLQARTALRMWQSGSPPVWPQPAGGPLDPLLADLRILFAYLPAPGGPGVRLDHSGASGLPPGANVTGAPGQAPSRYPVSPSQYGAYGAPAAPSSPLPYNSYGGSTPSAAEDWRWLTQDQPNAPPRRDVE